MVKSKYMFIPVAIFPNRSILKTERQEVFWQFETTKQFRPAVNISNLNEHFFSKYSH